MTETFVVNAHPVVGTVLCTRLLGAVGAQKASVAVACAVGAFAVPRAIIFAFSQRTIHPLPSTVALAKTTAALPVV